MRAYNFADDPVYVGIKIDDTHNPDVTITVQKIVVCSTTGGHIPQYNSKRSLTGCLTDTHFITKLYLVMVNRVVVCVLAFMIL